MRSLNIAIFCILLHLSTCLLHGQTVERSSNSLPSDQNNRVLEQISKKKDKGKKSKLPSIDLNHWKVTIPEGSPKVIEISPPEILDYATNEVLQPFMYNDSIRGAIVLHAYPKNTTANTKYSRTELREQMVPGDNSINWTFKDGGNLKVKMAMDAVSKDKNGKYHKVIIAQIHGRLTNEQRDLIGQKDNNAPPILKVYWQDGKIRVKTKILKNLAIDEKAMLYKDAWKDDDGYTFKQKVDFKKFSIRVEVESGKMVVSLNNQEYVVYDNLSITKWNVFENYFKVGNYLQTRDEGAYAKVRIYELDASH